MILVVFSWLAEPVQTKAIALKKNELLAAKFGELSSDDEEEAAAVVVAAFQDGAAVEEEAAVTVAAVAEEDAEGKGCTGGKGYNAAEKGSKKGGKGGKPATKRGKGCQQAEGD